MARKKGKNEVQRPKNRQSFDSKKFDRLKSLVCFDEVFQLLVNGWDATKVAAFIQNESSEYTDIRLESLTDILQDFRRSIPPAEMLEHRAPEVVEEAVEALENDVVVLDEMTKLYQIQWERIQIQYKREKQVGLLTRQTGGEVKVAAEILKQIDALKKASGMTRDRISRFKFELETTDDAQATSFAQRFIGDPAKRNQLLQFAQNMKNTDGRVLKALGVGALPTQSDEDDK